MNIFCKETQEHLQQIQAGVDSGVVSPNRDSGGQILITPDLWMYTKDRGRKRLMEREEEGEQERQRRHSTGSNTEQDKPLNLHTVKNVDMASKALDLRDIKEPISKKLDLEKLAEKPHSGMSIDRLNRFDRRLRENREKAKRSRSRDSTSTPLSVTTSPGSSQLSTSPSVTSALTPPIVNGLPQSVAPPGALLSALGPGMAGHPMLYPHLMAGGMPGFLPPGMMIPPEHAARLQMPMRVSSTPDGRSTPRTAAPLANQASPASSSHPPPPPPMPASAGMVRHPPPGAIPMLPPGMPFPPMPHPGMLPPHPMAGLLPPSTLLCPYPVFIPLPVPVPVVIPVKTDKDFKTLCNMYNKPSTKPKEVTVKTELTRPDSRPATSTTTNSMENIPPAAPPAPPLALPVPPPPPPPCSESNNGTREKIACACCQSEYRKDGHCGRTSTDSNGKDHCFKRPSSGDSDCGIITSSSDLEDVVIDLSKDKHSDRETSTVLNSVDQNKNNTNMIMIKPGIIPIIPMDSTDPVPPGLLSHPIGGHLMPPRDHSYSSRRGLILDAPSVPRDRNKSPSPEKRILLRSPSREMLLNKRRCLRRSIKTK